MQLSALSMNLFTNSFCTIVNYKWKFVMSLILCGLSCILLLPLLLYLFFCVCVCVFFLLRVNTSCIVCRFEIRLKPYNKIHYTLPTYIHTGKTEDKCEITHWKREKNDKTKLWTIHVITVYMENSVSKHTNKYLWATYNFEFMFNNKSSGFKSASIYGICILIYIEREMRWLRFLKLWENL